MSRTTRQPRTWAVVRQSWSPGWIWGVPIAAVALVLWLLLRSISSRGVEVTVTYDNAAGIQAGETPVIYHGLRVGRVTSVALAPDDWHITVGLEIDGRLAGRLDSGTRFILEGVHPRLSDPSSLRALIAGPTIVMVPGPGKPSRRFIGIEGGPLQTLAISLPYRVSFAGAVGRLRVRSPVTLRGFTVGEVASVGLQVNPRTGQVSTPVVIDLDPTRFHILGAAPESEDWRSIMNATLAKLVSVGLRARLSRAIPLIGGRRVVLDIEPRARPARLVMTGRYPRIPAGGAVGLAALPAELSSLPLRQIADNLRSVSASMRSLAASPRWQQSLTRLDRTLTALDRVARRAGPQIAPTLATLRQTIASLRGTARALDAAAEEARVTMAGSPASQGGNLRRALTQLTQAARAVQSLADYLDRHPGALLRGRRR